MLPLVWIGGLSRDQRSELISGDVPYLHFNLDGQIGQVVTGEKLQEACEVLDLSVASVVETEHPWLVKAMLSATLDYEPHSYLSRAIVSREFVREGERPVDRFVRLLGARRFAEHRALCEATERADSELQSLMAAVTEDQRTAAYWQYAAKKAKVLLDYHRTDLLGEVGRLSAHPRVERVYVDSSYAWYSIFTKELSVETLEPEPLKLGCYQIDIRSDLARHTAGILWTNTSVSLTDSQRQAPNVLQKGGARNPMAREMFKTLLSDGHMAACGWLALSYVELILEEDMDHELVRYWPNLEHN